MRLAFALYKYFPYGGLARDFMRIADTCLEKGYQIDVYVMEWQGGQKAGYNVSVLRSSGWSNHAKVADFHQQLRSRLEQKSYDAVIGFNKIPGVDVYYAADPCYIDRFSARSFFHKFNPRYRFYAGVEKAVFQAPSSTVCLMISDVQMALFKKHYQAVSERLVMLPPGIDINRRRPVDALRKRAAFRQQLGMPEQDLMVLMVGTGFKTKGVDRAIKAIAALPEALKSKTSLMVVGEDDLSSYERLTREYKVSERIHLMGGRSDVPDFLLAADMLLHPARKENTGTVILEAMVAGLPMLVTDVCGYAKYVTQSKAGAVMSSPFNQQLLNEQLVRMLTDGKTNERCEHALAFAKKEDLYSMPEKAVEAIETVIHRKRNEA